MKYRFMEIADLYSEYIDRFYESKYDTLSYDELHSRVLSDRYSESDYIHDYFRHELGIETMHVYYDFHQLQNRWDEDGNKDSFEILLRQIVFFNPDVIYVLNVWFFDAEKIKRIKECLHKDVLFVCYHFTNINDIVKENLSLYDLVFTGNYCCMEMIKEYNSNTKLVRHAFSPLVLNNIGKTSSQNKVSFAGSIVIGNNAHINRIDMFSALEKKKIDYDFYGKIYGSMFRRGAIYNGLNNGPLQYLEEIKTCNRLRQICKGSQFGLNYYRTLSQYSITLNLHPSNAGSGCGNQRMFEATGVGTCLVTDFREENELLFEEDSEIIAYRNFDELTDKLLFLLSHPEYAKNIALSGQKRTLDNYTYEHKAKLIDKYVREMLE